MTFLELLQHHQVERKSIRRLINGFGITKWSIFSEPLRKLSEDEIITLLLNWITRNLPAGRSTALRIRDHQSNDVYELWLTSDKGCLHVRGLFRRAQLNENLLYYCNEEMTPNDLTLEAITQSLEMVSYINA